MTMTTSSFYLRPNVVMEPLITQWYAWLHLVAPATAPLYVIQHLKIMQSFLAHPQIHVAAMKNPDLIGGPYVNYGIDKVGDVRSLVEVTKQEEAPSVEFAAAVQALDMMLNEHPRGMSLEELYPKVPALLRGYVELGYDVRNQPSMRFIERMLYRSEHYRESAQSLLLWRMDRDERPFIFSTPRLEESDNILLRTPFRSDAVDEILALRHRPAKVGHFQELLGVGADKEPLLRSFLTEDVPSPPASRYDGDGVRIRYFGHACLLIESKELAILTDPTLSYRYSAEPARFTYDDLPAKIDHVLITHAHADHFMLETLLQLRSRVESIVVPKSNGSLQDPSMRLLLENLGFPRVMELEELESLEVEGGAILGLPFLGEHGDLDVRSKLAYHVRLRGRTAVVAADSNALEPMLYRRLGEIIGPLDALFLGMECEGAPMSWVYGPMLLAQLARKMDQSRRLCGSNSRRASEIIDLLSPRQVHVYAMGQEPWLGHVMGLRYTSESPQLVESNELLEYCHERGIAAERPYCKRELLLEPLS
ncbi:MBL fold metallo-hydrolase [Paraliomyxa miuraensis]|uniref:MBL fold metallo-hydrolase n=1 Tax=Paraliomyxa miuraensis TaxID=376150 RepID=UPI002B1CAFB8|nr:MBL fold metallo-hydrolase [Paraliomyxa miuraensis]